MYLYVVHSTGWFCKWMYCTENMNVSPLLYVLGIIALKWYNWLLYTCVRATACCAAWPEGGVIDLAIHQVGLVPCHRSPSGPAAAWRAIVSLPVRTLLSKCISLLTSLLQPSVAVWCHMWQINTTSVKCFWIQGWVPWAAPAGPSRPGSRATPPVSNTWDHALLLTYFWQRVGDKTARPTACLPTHFWQIDVSIVVFPHTVLPALFLVPWLVAELRIPVFIFGLPVWVLLCEV